MDVSKTIVGTNEINDSSVTTVKINNSAVTTAKIADSNVTTAKIADSNVTSVKLATGTAERDWVLARTAAASAGAVGTYGFFYSSAVTSLGSTTSGANLNWSNAIGFNATASPSGTWRAMGVMQGGATDEERTTLWLRVS